MFVKRFNGERYFFKVKDIRMLDSVGKMLTKSITLKLPLEIISDQLLQELENICEENQGEHKFKMKVVDAENKIELDLISKNRFVNASNQFVRKVEGLGLPYKLN